MGNAFQKLLNTIAKQFGNDPSKMLIWTGVVGWAISSLAQIGAILFSSKFSDEQKSFLIPQEIADAFVNIIAFFLITKLTKESVSKLFKTGKLAPKSVRIFLEKNKDLYADKVGKLDFNLDDVLLRHKDFPIKSYTTTKNYATTLATVGAGVVSSNIVTPILRNNLASRMQKNYIDYKNQPESQAEYKPKLNKPNIPSPSVYTSQGMRV